MTRSQLTDRLRYLYVYWGGIFAAIFCFTIAIVALTIPLFRFVLAPWPAICGYQVLRWRHRSLS